MKKNIAVIGCGHWGKNLVRNFAELDALGSICDPNVELANKFSEQFGVKNSEFEQIIRDKTIEGIVLAVPAPFHADMAVEAMNSGKHVYVEKPLALNKAEAEQMIISAEDNNVQLMVGHLLQYHPVFMKVRKLVESGEVGKLNYIYSNRLSFGKVRSEEDVIWSFGPHDISMILSLTKEEPETINTEATSILQTGIADMATLHLNFKSGIKSHISLSWLHPNKEQKLVVIGDSAMMVFDDTQSHDKKLALYRHKIESENNITNLVASEVEYIEVDQTEPLKNECLHFLHVVNKNIIPRTNGNEGMKVLEVLSAASLSHSISRTVKLNNH